MAFIDDIASKLSGRTRAETNSVMTDATTRTYVGTATSASEDGSVYVALSQDVTLPDDDDGEHGLGVEMPTTVAVDEGDEVLVTVFGGGVMKAPVVTGNPGFGDRIQTQVDNAETLATEAQEVAQATGQHFWEGDDGAHVTQVTRTEWESVTPHGTGKGPNSLWNSLGMLFRDGLTNLMAVLPQNELVESFVCPDVSAVTFVQFTTSERPRSIVSVTVDGEVPSYPWHMNKKGVYFSGNASFKPHEGQEVIVTYISVSSLTIFDGLGNLASNVSAKFSDAFVSLAKGVFQFEVGDVSYGSQTVSMALSPDDEQHAEIRLTKDINNDRAYIALQADNSTSFAAIVVDTGGAFTGRVADFAYVDTLHFTESTFIPIAQANVGLAQPTATYTGSSSTTTDSASGWKLTWFNVALATNGPVGDYFTNSNGVITAVRDCKLLVSCVMRWQDTVAGQRGIGLFTGVNGGDSGGTEAASSFGYSSNTNNSNRTVYLPPRLFSLAAGDHITVRRNTQAKAKYTNGPNFSWLTVEVVG